MGSCVDVMSIKASRVLCALRQRRTDEPQLDIFREEPEVDEGNWERVGRFEG